jgi:hypothetical protein
MVMPLETWRPSTRLKIGCSFSSKGSNKAATRGIAYHNKIFTMLERYPIPGMTLMVEPWFKAEGQNRFCQPDAVFVDKEAGSGLVIEVKLNWKDGRADKLHSLYLPVVKQALGLNMVWPLVITQNLRGSPHPPLLGLHDLVEAMAWTPADPTPLMLVP